MQTQNYKNKKVLIFGLGILGGGVATANWFLKRGARVTITDLKSRTELAPSIRKIKGHATYHLYGHTKADIDTSDVIVLNQDVPITSPFVQYALKKKKAVKNDAVLFYENYPGTIVAITGTRGKTTTTLWTDHFLRGQFRSSIAGNSTTHPYPQVLDAKPQPDIAVTEIPSAQLELFPIHRAPNVAVITNLSPDHLNRHGSLKTYALIKANLFRNQTSRDALILNADDSWTPRFLRFKPQAVVFFFSLHNLPSKKSGLFLSGTDAYFQIDGNKKKVFSIEGFARGHHNTANLLAAALASHAAGCSWNTIARRIATLPHPEFRQQVVLKTKTLTVINDTTATSPEGAIAALRRFAKPNTVFIFGGTDRQLEFKGWAREVKKLSRNNVFFLAGSATDKMLTALAWKHAQVFDTLTECVQAALKKSKDYPTATLVFSPGAKSFEKFKNEYDRGQQFNAIIKKLR